jgi:hypothetical protein
MHLLCLTCGMDIANFIQLFPYKFPAVEDYDVRPKLKPQFS